MLGIAEQQRTIITNPSLFTESERKDHGKLHTRFLSEPARCARPRRPSTVFQSAVAKRDRDGHTASEGGKYYNRQQAENWENPKEIDVGAILGASISPLPYHGRDTLRSDFNSHEKTAREIALEYVEWRVQKAELDAILVLFAYEL